MACRLCHSLFCEGLAHPWEERPTLRSVLVYLFPMVASVDGRNPDPEVDNLCRVHGTNLYDHLLACRLGDRGLRVFPILFGRNPCRGRPSLYEVVLCPNGGLGLRMNGRIPVCHKEPGSFRCFGPSVT